MNLGSWLALPEGFFSKYFSYLFEFFQNLGPMMNNKSIWFLVEQVNYNYVWCGMTELFFHSYNLKL
jgi:hypothetical protein